MRLCLGLAEGGPARIGGILQHAPPHTAIPVGFAGGGGNALGIKSAGDLTEAQALNADPAKNLAHGGGLGQIDHSTPTPGCAAARTFRRAGAAGPAAARG